MGYAPDVQRMIISKLTDKTRPSSWARTWPRHWGTRIRKKALRDHVDEDDRTVNESFTVNGTQPVLINESGLYALILSSKLKEAKPVGRLW